MTDAATIRRGRSEFGDTGTRYLYVYRSLGPTVNRLTINLLRDRAYAKARNSSGEQGTI